AGSRYRSVMNTGRSAAIWRAMTAAIHRVLGKRRHEKINPANPSAAVTPKRTPGNRTPCSRKLRITRTSSYSKAFQKLAPLRATGRAHAAGAAAIEFLALL